MRGGKIKKMENRAKLYLIIAAAAAAVAVFWWWRQTNEKIVAPTPTPGGIGSDLYQKAGNPAEKLPEVNPLGNKPDTNPLSETNPFKNVKTNPFE